MNITFPFKFFSAMILISILIVLSNVFIPQSFPIFEKIEGLIAALIVFVLLKLLNRKGYLNRSFPDAVNVFFLVGGIALPLVIVFTFLP